MSVCRVPPTSTHPQTLSNLVEHLTFIYGSVWELGYPGLNSSSGTLHLEVGVHFFRKGSANRGE